MPIDPNHGRRRPNVFFAALTRLKMLEGALTKEHVYSNWTRRFVPRNIKMFRSLRATALPDRTDFVFAKRPADIRNWQVLCVCAACNNGWMRQQIENRARPVMMRLIKGQYVRLSLHQQQIIATWAAMKAMVAEYDESESVTIHHAHRKIFKETLPSARKRMVNLDRALPPTERADDVVRIPVSSVAGSPSRAATISTRHLL
jgi:hypothetical protein